MTTPTSTVPSRPELDLLLAAALRAAQAAAEPPGETTRRRVTGRLVAGLLTVATLVGLYDAALLAAA